MSFDLLAPHYRWMELVLAGRILQRARTAHLSQVLDRKQALILGEGNGRFLSELIARNQSMQITCLDASGRMLEEARRRVSRRHPGQPIRWIQADALEGIPSGPYDLIVSHFFLDCFLEEQIQTLVPSVAREASADAVWLIADFGEAESGFSRLRSRIILWMMYRFFRVTTGLPGRWTVAPDPYLRRAGFALTHRQTFEWGLIHSDLWKRGAPGSSVGS